MHLQRTRRADPVCRDADREPAGPLVAHAHEVQHQTPGHRPGDSGQDREHGGQRGCAADLRRQPHRHRRRGRLGSEGEDGLSARAERGRDRDRGDDGGQRADPDRDQQGQRCPPSNQAIASRLVLSQKTVRNHLSNIFSKLQVVDRSEAIVLAREAGLGIPHEAG